MLSVEKKEKHKRLNSNILLNYKLMKTTNKILLAAFLIILAGIAAILITLRIHLSEMEPSMQKENNISPATDPIEMSYN